MLAELIEYQRPAGLAEAGALLARTRPHTVPLAGGTALAAGAGPGVEAVVDLGRLGLNFIRVDPDGLVIGAMATLQSLVEDRACRTLWWGTLSAAARSSVTRLLRNAATVGGTLASGPAARADLAVVLLALEATVRVLDPDLNERWLAMSELAGGLARPGLIVELRVPHPDPLDLLAGTAPAGAAVPSTGAAFLRVARTPSDTALLHVAAVVESSASAGCRLRVAVGGVGWEPARVPALEAALSGTRLTDADLDRAVATSLGSVHPPTDFRASGRYRGEVTAVLLRRAVRQAADRALALRFHPLIGGEE